MKRLIYLLILIPLVFNSQTKDEWWWMQKTGTVAPIALIANTDTVQVNEPLGVTGTGTGFAVNPSIECVMYSNQARISKTGYISKIVCQFTGTVGLTNIQFFTLHQTTSTAFIHNGYSENILTKITDTTKAVTIRFATPVYAYAGDYYGFYVQGVNTHFISVVSDVSAGHEIIYYTSIGQIADGSDITGLNPTSNRYGCVCYSTPAEIILVNGDSRTGGSFMEHGTGSLYTHLDLQSRLQWSRNWIAYGIGAGGNTVSTANARDTGTMFQRAKIMVFIAQVNDVYANNPTVNILNNLSSVADSCNKYGVKLYYEFYSAWDSTAGKGLVSQHLVIDSLRTLIPALATSKGFVFIDNSAVVGTDRATLYTGNCYNFKTGYSDDGTHLNTYGLDCEVRGIDSIIDLKYTRSLSGTAYAYFAHTQPQTTLNSHSFPLALSATIFDSTYTQTGNYLQYKKGVNGTVTTTALTQTAATWIYTINWLPDTANFVNGDTAIYRFIDSSKYTSASSWYLVKIIVAPFDYRTNIIYEWYPDSNFSTTWRNTVDTCAMRGVLPTLQTNMLNGHSAVYYDGTTTVAYITAKTINNFTIHIVAKELLTYPAVSILAAYDGANYIMMNDNALNYGFGITGASGNRYLPIASRDTLWHLYTFRNDSLFKDGVRLTSYIIKDAASTAFSFTWIGAYNATQYFFLGKVAYYGFYSEQSTDAAILQKYNYLVWLLNWTGK